MLKVETALFEMQIVVNVADVAVHVTRVWLARRLSAGSLFPRPSS